MKRKDVEARLYPFKQRNPRYQSNVLTKHEGFLPSGSVSVTLKKYNYYDDNAPSNDERWYIGTTTLSQVSGCNRQNIADWVKTHQLTVDDHNNKYELGQYHNKRHKGIEITNLVRLWE